MFAALSTSGDTMRLASPKPLARISGTLSVYGALFVLAVSGGGAAATSARPQQPLPSAGSAPSGALDLVSSTAAGQAVGGYEPCGISADGQWVTFMSESSALVANDTNGVEDIFVKNLVTGAVQRVSTSSSGKQWTRPAACRQVTPDGRYVLMQMDKTVLLKDVQTGAVRTVSPAADSLPENTGFSAGSVSDDGQRVTIVTIPTQTYLGAYNWVNNVPARILVRNVATGSLTTLDTDSGRTADGEIILGHLNARLSPDGSRVAFVSSSSALVEGDTNGQPDVFVRDLATGATVLASSSSSGVPGELTYCCAQGYYRVEWVNNSVLQFSVSQAHSLGPVGDYLKHLETGQLELLLASSDGASPVVSADLATVVFGRLYGNGFSYRLYQRDRTTGTEQVVSSSSTGKPGNGHANTGPISRDGKRVAFSGNASNLIKPRPPAGSFQVYVKTLGAP
jgi:WD40-like Beta Propeller Repeat